eukprot:TRINITY_DN3180_c0_g1_i2.p1 TRINITY_DN3180_c0_g1~~TRINITY_DN3180_c0_g1_i2.p1  ORF type:complete len:155 (-),score=33.00 TRINITY_DN3180_c0_g1_i2:183-647(-)
MSSEKHAPVTSRPAMTKSTRSTEQDFDIFLFVRIPRSEERIEASTGKKYTVYQLIVENNQTNWEIFRRFSEFDALYQTLNRKFPGQVPDFPVGSKILGFAMDVVEKRRVALEKFILDLLENPVFMFQCDDLQVFLESKDKITNAVPPKSGKSAK